MAEVLDTKNSLQMEPADFKISFEIATAPLGDGFTAIGADRPNLNHLDEDMQRFQRKLIFLEICLFEYMVRTHVHLKGLEFTRRNLQSVAIRLSAMLEIDSFFPDAEWITEALGKYNGTSVVLKSRRVPLSLDLRDIVSYCGNHVQRTVMAKKVVSASPQDQNDENKENREPTPEPSQESKPQKYRSIREDRMRIKKMPVLCYKEALRRLTPLKKFALIKENHQAFGLLTQLDKVFISGSKNGKSPK